MNPKRICEKLWTICSKNLENTLIVTLVLFSGFFSYYKNKSNSLSPLDINSNELHSAASLIERERVISAIVLCSLQPQRITDLIINDKDPYWQEFFLLLTYLSRRGNEYIHNGSFINKSCVFYQDDLEKIATGSRLTSEEAMNFLTTQFQ